MRKDRKNAILSHEVVSGMQGEDHCVPVTK